MAAEVQFIPLDDQGPGLLDALEAKTDARPFIANIGTGARTYYLNSAGVDGFDAMLDTIYPAWREHLVRTGS